MKRLTTSLPDDVCRFIARHIHTLEQLEILLLLVDNPGRSWSASELAAELRSAPDSVRDRLSSLNVGGLTMMSTTAVPLYRYQPVSGQLDEQARKLIACYRERRVAVITEIFAPPGGNARVFADAFRIKKGDS